MVDVACGTGDLIEAFRQSLGNHQITAARPFADPGQYIGVDFTFEMLPIARTQRVD